MSSSQFLFGSCEVDQLRLLRGEIGARSPGPCFNPGDVLFLDPLEILLRRGAYAPPEIVINERRRSATVVHWLIHQIRVEESEQNRGQR